MGASAWTPVDESAWSDVPEQAQPVAASPADAATSISPAPKGAAAVADWFKKLQGDLKYGGGATLPGRAFEALGGQPAYNGVSPEAADTVASVPLGLAKSYQGGAEWLTGSPWQGAQHMVGGALQAATIPGAFVAPEAAPRGAAMLEDAVNNFPTKSKAQALFQAISEAIGDAPVNGTLPARTTAVQARGFANTGAQMPKVLSDFLARTEESPLNPALSFDEGRNFYSNASGMSQADKMATNPSMHRYVSQFTGDMGDALSNTAGAHGQGVQYDQAMEMWRRVKRIQEFMDNAKKVGKAAAWGAAPAAVGGYYLKQLADYKK